MGARINSLLLRPGSRFDAMDGARVRVLVYDQAHTGGGCAFALALSKGGGVSAAQPSAEKSRPPIAPGSSEGAAGWEEAQRGGTRPAWGHPPPAAPALSPLSNLTWIHAGGVKIACTRR